MADKYIRKEDAKYALQEKVFHDLTDEFYGAMQVLDELPTADVAPVVHSRWKYKCGEIQCPECRNRIHRIDLSGCLNFCPNCGAKMDGGDEHG
jgi:hypothetical protein